MWYRITGRARTTAAMFFIFQNSTRALQKTKPTPHPPQLP